MSRRDWETGYWSTYPCRHKLGRGEWCKLKQRGGAQNYTRCFRLVGVLYRTKGKHWSESNAGVQGLHQDLL